MSKEPKNIIQESLFTEEECPSIEPTSKNSNRKQENRIQCFVSNKNSLDRINYLADTSNQHRNIILNQLIEIGLPILEKRYGLYSNEEEQNIINQKDELIQAQQKTIDILTEQNATLQNQMLKNFKAIRDELTHINATTSIQEYINSSTYEHLKLLLNLFIATNNAGTLSEELSDTYDNRIASQFLERKMDALNDFKKPINVQFTKSKEGDK